VARRDFSGRVVAITGAAGGLGRALCRAFDRRGARIAALDRDEQGLAALARELEAAGIAAQIIPCDVTQLESCRTALASVTNGIDVLVNNAGISHRSAFADTDPEVIRRVMDVNFFGALNCTHAALPALLARRGLVIAISSVAGFAPLLARTGYAASKHALHGLFDTLRVELAPQGVGVLIVCPSFIRTAIAAAHLLGDGQAARHPRAVVGDLLDPDEVAARIVDAAERGRRLLLVGRVAWTSYWVSRLAPALYARLMARRMRGELHL
jgi:NAD(P)-dependent dehydrogenase (short-subunit alcohol dehydrogenase family)